MACMVVEEVCSRFEEEICLLPAALLVAERRNNFASRQHAFKLRKCVVNICEAAPVHVKSFIRKKAAKNLKFAELTNSQRLGRSPSTRSGVDSTVYDLSNIARRSKILYYA